MRVPSRASCGSMRTRPAELLRVRWGVEAGRPWFLSCEGRPSRRRSGCSRADTCAQIRGCPSRRFAPEEALRPSSVRIRGRVPGSTEAPTSRSPSERARAGRFRSQTPRLPARTVRGSKAWRRIALGSGDLRERWPIGSFSGPQSHPMSRGGDGANRAGARRLKVSALASADQGGCSRVRPLRRSRFAAPRRS